MKTTRECDQQERMLRALLVLDGMTYFMEDIMNKTPETPVEHFVHNVYMIAHSAQGSCGNPHENWLDVIDEQAKLLKEANAMDLEKVLQEFKDGTRPKKSSGMGILDAIKEDSEIK